MPEPPTWPPPPNTPNLLSAHDDFLIACIRNSMPKVPLSRLRLVINLRDETGLDLRSCRIVVNNFCDRHTILMPLGGFWTWGVGCLLIFITLTMVVADCITYIISADRISAAVTPMEMVMITNEMKNTVFVYMGVYLTALCAIVVLVSLQQRKKMREQAAEARAKFA